ncbi:acetyltransferase [Roseivivax sp. GX 12232]|uniref:GNAT family N-acetyltransferase n=1 Tax=Roseivivax sp. GX 12232 TaxID=2900547 RepID=UPI001E4610B1|nr:GNAT family N-acetyltransferase [Roseivivax sp. GX 12232]MCE0505925.1 acetyltransferase [Roseivivax sp. GX 12232]
MTGTQNYRFRRANVDDLALIRAWQLKSHVREWWDANEPYAEADLADPRVARWIVSFGMRPFAFMQDYTVHGWGDHHFDHHPKGTRGIDQFIGEPDMVGIGHGSAFIGTRMQALFDEGAPIIATDPHPDNARAVAVYKKLGFSPSGPLQETDWGLILPMTARR